VFIGGRYRQTFSSADLGALACENTMKTEIQKMVVLLVAVLSWSGMEAGAGAEPVTDSPPKSSLPTEKTAGANARSPAERGANSSIGLVVRGWEIQSVLAIRQPAVADIIPAYDAQKRPTGNLTASLRTARGGFLIVQVQCTWGTLDPPHVGPWVGRPDVTLVDETGTEYPVLDTLSRQAGQLITHGMLSAHRHKVPGAVADQTIRVLLYFDVPASSKSFWLRFPRSGSSLVVTQVAELPDSNSDIVN
jgi:hypothetical protein